MSNLVVILNTHMPAVLGQGQIFGEPENWLYEAITETYIPLFRAFSRWRPDGRVDKKFVLSFTPCLLEQLVACRERYLAYLEIMHRIAERELERTRSLSAFNRQQRHPRDLSASQLQQLHGTARAYAARISDAAAFVREHELVPFVQALIADHPDRLELWTSAPHHNFLPFFERATVDHLVQRGVDEFGRFFERAPDGFWLPECAFLPGIEDSLARAGVTRTAMTPSAIALYNPKVTSGYYQHKGLQLYIHDFRLAMHLWKVEDHTTLPANPVYREFFRDMGWDVRPEYLADLGLPPAPREDRGVWTGFKYHAISGRDVTLADKQLYDVTAGRAQARRDVARFLRVLDSKRNLVHDQETFIMAFDTEIFGHWWHEGVYWLEDLLRCDLAKEMEAAA